MPTSFDPMGSLRTAPAYMNERPAEKQPWLTPERMALLGAAAGFLDPNGGTVAGFQNAMQGLQLGNQIKSQAAQKELIARKLQKQIEIENYMRSLSEKHGGNLQGLLQEGMASGIPEVMGTMSKIAGGLKGQYLKSQAHDGTGTYQYANNIGQVTPTGIPLPPEKLMQINRGNQIDLANPFTGEAHKSIGVGMAPGQAAQLAQSQNQFNMSHALAQQNSALNQYKAMMEMNPEFLAQKAGAIEGAKFGAKTQAQAQADLPQVVQQGEQTIKLVDDMLNHPGFNISVGAKSPVGKVASFIPGTDAASFDIASKQMLGKQFLQAFESLKGGGQITQIEGEKATQAMSRMNTSNSQEEYTKAAREFQDIIRSGINRAKQKAGVQGNSFADGWGDLK